MLGHHQFMGGFWRGLALLSFMLSRLCFSPRRVPGRCSLLQTPDYTCSASAIIRHLENSYPAISCNPYSSAVPCIHVKSQSPVKRGCRFLLKDLSTGYRAGYRRATFPFSFADLVCIKMSSSPFYHLISRCSLYWNNILRHIPHLWQQLCTVQGFVFTLLCWLLK